jgi:Domain of unknown function (DUF303).
MSFRLTGAGKALLQNGKFALTGAATPAAGALRIGLIGQSNMANFPTIPYEYPLGSPAVKEYNAGALKRIGNVNDSFPPNTISSGGYGGAYTNNGDSRIGDGFVYFANLMASGTGRDVVIVEGAVGGSAIDSWLVGGNNWTSYLTQFNASGGYLDMVIWYQGENDAHTMSTATMKTKLAQLHAQCKTVLGNDNASFKFGVVSLATGGGYAGIVEGDMGRMRAAHVEYATTTPGAFLAGANHDMQTSDGIHIDGVSHAKGGRREAQAALTALGIGVGGAGPRITGATRSGLVVTAQIAHSGGTALLDGIGGSGGALTGHEFNDAGAGGAVIATTATAIAGNTIQYTLASSPVGALTLSYGMMNAPHGTLSAANLATVPYDNATYFRSLNGFPMQPLAAITVS